MKSCHLNQLCAAMACIFFLICGALAKAAEAEGGLMLCTDSKSESRSKLVIRPDLMAAQKPCDGRGIWEQVTDSNLTTIYGQCSSINIACLVESSPGFERTIEQITALNETGQVSPVIMVPMAANNAVQQRVGVSVFAFVLVSQIYLYSYAGAGLYDTLALSLLAAGFSYVQPQILTNLWFMINSWIPDIFRDKEPSEPSAGNRATENYGSSSNTLYGSAKKDQLKRVSFGKNMHKLNYD